MTCKRILAAGGRSLGVIGEIALYALGLAASALLAWQVAALVTLVTVGPGGPALRPPAASQPGLCVLALVTLAATAVAARRARSKLAGFESAVWQMGSGLVVLSVSYRFMALLLLLVLLAWHALRPAQRAAAWRLWVVILVTSLAPVDVSLRRGFSPSRLVPAENCGSRLQVEADNAGRLVCLNGGVWLDTEPRMVWVW